MHAEALPAAPEAVAGDLAELARAGKSVATINVALAALQHVHRQAGHALNRDNRAIFTVMAGIGRRSSRQIRRAAALELADLSPIIAGIEGDDVRDLRDRAVLLVGFFGALRRSEIVALDADGEKPRGGRSSRSVPRAGWYISPEPRLAQRRRRAIPRRNDELCAACAVERYLAAAGLTHGALFRPVSKAGRLIPRRLDATAVRHILGSRAGSNWFSPHSLRAGFITSAAKANVPEHVIPRTSRHKSADGCC